MKKIFSTRNFALILCIFFIGIIDYNFNIANSYKYESAGDAWSFINLGLSLAKTAKYGQLKVERNQLINDFKENKVATKTYAFSYHTTWRTPVWPLLIAFIFLIFGYKLIYILIFKFILHLLGTYIFYKTLKLLEVKEFLILTGCFLYGVSPAWELYSRVFLSEPITLFILSLLVYYLLRFLKGKSIFFPQAVLGGVLVLSHPYYIFLPFSIWFFLLVWRQIKMSVFAFSCIIGMVIVSSWVIRNCIILNTTQPIITTSSGAVMAKGWNKEVIKKHTNTQGDLADETIVLQDYKYDRGKKYDEVELSNLYTSAVFNFIKSNPRKIFPIILVKLKSAFNPFSETPKAGALETGRVIYQLLGLIALIYILFFSTNTILKAFALAMLTATVAITIVTYSGFRFRMPQSSIEILFMIICINEVYLNRKHPSISS